LLKESLSKVHPDLVDGSSVTVRRDVECAAECLLREIPSTRIPVNGPFETADERFHLRGKLEWVFDVSNLELGGKFLRQCVPNCVLRCLVFRMSVPMFDRRVGSYRESREDLITAVLPDS